MAELELVRSPDDRRLYAIDGVGTLRLGGWLSSAATADAESGHWSFSRRRLAGRLEARDAAGTMVGTFSGRLLGGGTLSWHGRELAVRRASLWRERYAVADGDDELAVLDGRSWGKRPVRVTLADPAALEPGLLLFAAYVVRTLAGDSDSSAGATAVG